MEGCCRRQCTEARSVDESARSENIFSPLFFSSALRGGYRICEKGGGNT